jgi:hypothetical protein
MKNPRKSISGDGVLSISSRCVQTRKIFILTEIYLGRFLFLIRVQLKIWYKIEQRVLFVKKICLFRNRLEVSAIVLGKKSKEN